MTPGLAIAAESVTIDQQALSGILTDVLIDRLMAFGVKLTIFLFFVTFTIAVCLHLFGRLQFPAGFRRYVYGTYVALMIGAAFSYQTGGPTAEASAKSAAREITNVLLDSGRASERRSEAVVPESAPEPSGEAVGKIVYIQTPNVAVRADAEAVQRALQKAGYAAPGIEILDPLLTPGTAEVRYFNAGDKASALKVAEIAGANGLPVPPDKVKQQEGYKAPPGQIELWYPRPRQIGLDGAAERAAPETVARKSHAPAEDVRVVDAAASTGHLVAVRSSRRTRCATSC